MTKKKKQKNINMGKFLQTMRTRFHANDSDVDLQIFVNVGECLVRLNLKIVK